jgi:ABC-type polysaccharide/polyol phosphate transport system ATPase subunit
LVLQIVNLSKKYAWHRAPRGVEDDDPELVEEVDAPPLQDAEPSGERWALRGINATIIPGEKVGIIGANGAGKSTLLNILAGITLPSGGYVRGKGLRVLLNSLRTPFRGQLTGRQNLHILAALLGVEVARLEARLPEILAFSGMEDFIDRRVWHYSTQQYRRLTFAAALMLDPEIILSDDTLGIGDARYQQRTEQLIAEKVEKEGVIFVFASNSLSAVQSLCTRVIWLEHGRVAADGPAEQVIEAFMDADKSEDDEPMGEIEGESGMAGPVPAASWPPASPDVADPALTARSDASSAPEPRATAEERDDLVSSAEIPIDADGAPPARVPLPEWSERARQAAEHRKMADRNRIERWNQIERPWLSAEKSIASVPGLGELEDLRFNLGDGIETDKSSLQITVRVEMPGTEVSILVDGLVGKTHIYSSEIPACLSVPAAGCYFFTTYIDNILFQARVFDLPYAKCKLRIKVHLRAPGSDRWHLLSGSVRVQLPGEEWKPKVAYPEYAPGPALMPLLAWNVEMTADLTEADRARSDQCTEQEVSAGSGSRRVLP